MRRTIAAASCALVVVATSLAVATPALAGGTALLNETFENSTATAALTLPPSIDHVVNSACLTAGTDPSQVPVPGCDLGTPDADGSGALRLTEATTGQVGGVFSDLSLPATAGLDDTFTLYQYGGSAPQADGIAFVINAENPADPGPPTQIGPTGGALGYSATYPLSVSPADGLADGYLGIGFDTYGNFSGPGYEGTGCTDPTWLGGDPNQVVARGPGNGLVGYCALDGSLPTYGGTQAIGSTGTSRSAAGVPVEIVLNPTASARAMTGTGFTAISVPAGDYGVAWTPIGGTAKDFVGPLPSTTNGGIPAGLYPASWVNPATGIPWQLGFGWVASTGSFTNIHEVTNATSTTIGQVPVLTAAITDGQSHDLPLGGTATYRLTAGVSGDGANETQAVTMATTLPAGLTPGSASGSGWTCTTTGQTVSCTHPASPAISAGTTLPVVSFSAAVAAGASTVAGALSATVIVTSNDANPGQATDVASASAPVATTYGYRQVGRDGGVFDFGTDNFYGSIPETSVAPFVKDIVGISPTTTDHGYWLAGADGGVFAFGDAAFAGSLPSLGITAANITGIASDPTASGYWLVGSDGGVFAFGGATFYGALPFTTTVDDIVGMAPTPDGQGYWLVGADGSVYPFGDAQSLGSEAGMALKGPITGIAAAAGPAQGYWLVGTDGGVFAFGSAGFYGSDGAQVASGTVVGLSPTGDGAGYWLAKSDGTALDYGDAPSLGTAGSNLAAPIVSQGR
jgi:hypothetical protein